MLFHGLHWIICKHSQVQGSGLGTKTKLKARSPCKKPLWTRGRSLQSILISLRLMEQATFINMLTYSHFESHIFHHAYFPGPQNTKPRSPSGQRNGVLGRYETFWAPMLKWRWASGTRLKHLSVLPWFLC